jgi:hypothetical protein
LKVLAASFAAALVCASAGAARAPSVNLLESFKPLLAKIERSSTAPVLLPASFPILDKLKVYASGGATKASWDLELAFARNCGSATACFLASFEGQKAASLPETANARLAGGDPALFEKSTCGASCAPASLWFVHDGVLYSWQDSDIPAKTAEAFLFRLANEAIAAGPR